MREDREGGEEGCEEKNKKTEGKSGKGKGPKGSTRLAYVGSSMQLAILRCPLSRVVIRRIFKVLLVAAPPLPFEPKQSARFFFAKWPGRERGRAEETDYVLDFNWKTKGWEWMGVRETPRCNGGKRERERGRGRQTKRKEKEKEGKFSRPREGITG